MKNRTRKVAIALAGLLAASVVSSAETDQRVAESRMAVKSFATQLKSELVGAMKSGGPTKAISVCHMKAPEIAKSVSHAKGWAIGRTSLKTRNPGNAPDAWEKAVLLKFEQRKAQGEPVKKMEYSAVVDHDGKREFRYMKAIPTGEVCLACHGSHIAPSVISKLDALYPRDQARGFKKGDIRGAFTIRQPLD